MEFVIREKRTNYKISCLLGSGQGEGAGGRSIIDGFNIEEGLNRTFTVFLTSFGDWVSFVIEHNLSAWITSTHNTGVIE